MSNNKDFEVGSLFDVSQRVAVVTGGGTGIGLMATQALAVNGAKVYILGRRLEALQNAAETHGKGIKGQIIPVQCDVTDKDSIEKAVQHISSKEKCICALINNAGVATGHHPVSESGSGHEFRENLFHDDGSTFESFGEVFRTNIASIYFVTTAFLPLVEAATKHQAGYSGTVINITSISGMTNRSQNHFAYNASKAAALHVTKMLASEIVNNGVRVRINSIAPGVFPSEMTAKTESDENQKNQLDQDKFKELPSRRSGQDRDMAQAIVFAVSNQYLNGQNIAVDGGFLLTTGT